MLGYEIFVKTDKLSKALQTTSMSAAQGQELAKDIVKVLEGMRDDADKFFSRVTSKATHLGIH